MVRINILSGSLGNPFFAQWDKDKYPVTQYDIRENSEEDIDWDVVVVYENVKGLRSFKCRKGCLLYFAGEPPLMRPLPNVFLKQFDEVYVPNEKAKHPNKHLSHGFLNWSLGVSFKTKQHRYDYDQLKNLKTPKSKNISIVTSTQKMMPGHNRRMHIIEQLRKDFPNDIDFYGRGCNFVDYKVDALSPYRFHICMENSSIPYYWTEKMADPILANSVPVYAGCTNVEDYLDSKGFIQFDITDYNGLRQMVEKILVNPEAEYQKYLPYLKENKKTIMEKENLIPFVINWYQDSCQNAEIVQHQIKALNDFPSYNREMYLIRLKRFMFKKIYVLKNMFYF